MILQNWKTECITRIDHKIIKLSGDKTSTIYLKNPAQIRVARYMVDGCAILDGLRCDWLIVAENSPAIEEIFIELKGSHIEHAIKQLERSIECLSADPIRATKRCLIALTRTPMTGTDIANQKKRFQKKYNARFIPCRDGSEHDL